MSISVELESKILRHYHAEQWKVGTIAKQFGIHHSTVTRVLMHAGVPKERLIRTSIVDPYLKFILDQLQRYPSLCASRLYAMVRERGYKGGEDHFRSLIALYRPRKVAEAYLRLRTLPGEQGQVDWGSFGHITIGSAKRPLMAFVMVLSYSRKVFLRFYLNAQMSNFLKGHEGAFNAFGGVPRVLLFDNLKSCVLEREGDAIRFNPTLLEFAGHYHFEPRPVAVARGNEKGRVERKIRHIRDNFFAGLEFNGIDDLNAKADIWCSTIAAERPCPEDKRMSVQEAFVEEQPKLLTLPNNPYATDERLEVHIGKTPYARYDLNDYSIPYTHVRQTLTVIGKTDKVLILDGSKVLAEHQRSYDKGQQIEDPAHIAELVERKRLAREHRNKDYLHHALPSAKQLFIQAGEIGHSLRFVTTQLEKMLAVHGPIALNAAIDEVLKNGSPHPNAIRTVLKRGQELMKSPVLIGAELQDPRARALFIKPHNLSDYDPSNNSEQNI